MIFRILFLNLLITALPLSAETRVWRNADDTKSIEGLFVKRDDSSVTILRSDRREVTIPLEMIHPHDREWLDARHPLPSEEPPPPAQHVFDTLEFGDSRAQVAEKLKASELVKTTLPEALLARTGLNGAYHTVRKIGGLEAALYFDWCGNGGLSEVTLQTTPLSGDGIEEPLTRCWREFIELLTSLHGEPVQAIEMLDISAIPAASMSATHLWKLEHRGTVMLGGARDGDGYLIAVRFTTEDIKPLVIPAPNPTLEEPLQ